MRTAPDLDWPPKAYWPGSEYVKYAEVYDALYGSLDRDAAFYLRCAREHVGRGQSVLELGAGTGRLAEKLLRQGFSVTAVDVNAQMLARARKKLSRFGRRCRLERADVASLRLGARFPLAVAPFGMVAHLLDDSRRLAAFKAVRRHLLPGGWFVFDDMPGWMSGASDGAHLSVKKQVRDPRTRRTIRLSTNCVDIADRPLTARYDIIDWLDRRGRAFRRVLVRIVFRNIELRRELGLLRSAGFDRVELLGGFDGRPLDRRRPSKNARLILRCRAGA